MTKYEMLKFLIENNKLGIFVGDPIEVALEQKDKEMLNYLISLNKFQLKSPHLSIPVKNNDLESLLILFNHGVTVENEIFKDLDSASEEIYRTIMIYLDPQQKSSLFSFALLYCRLEIIKTLPIISIRDNDKKNIVAWLSRGRHDFLDSIFESISLPGSDRAISENLLSEIAHRVTILNDPIMLTRIIRKANFYDHPLLLRCIFNNQIEACRELIMFGKYNDYSDVENSPILLTCRKIINEEIFDIFLEISDLNKPIIKEYIFDHNIFTGYGVEFGRIMKIFNRGKLYEGEFDKCFQMFSQIKLKGIRSKFLLPFVNYRDEKGYNLPMMIFKNRYYFSEMIFEFPELGDLNHVNNDGLNILDMILDKGKFYMLEKLDFVKFCLKHFKDLMVKNPVYFDKLSTLL